MSFVGNTLLCDCSLFVRWYTNDQVPSEPIEVCRCGHPASEHLNGAGSCTGELMSA